MTCSAKRMVARETDGRLQIGTQLSCVLSCSGASTFSFWMEASR